MLGKYSADGSISQDTLYGFSNVPYVSHAVVHNNDVCVVRRGAAREIILEAYP